MTNADDPAEKRPKPGDGEAAGKPDAKPAFRFEGAHVRMRSAPPTAAPPSPAEAPPRADAPVAASPSPAEAAAESARTADPDAEIAAAMARVRQRLDRIAGQQAAQSPRAAPLPAAAIALRRRRFEPWIAGVAALVACMLVVGGYLAAAVPGSWFANESPRRFTVEELQLTRGSGTRAAGALVVQAPGEGGIAIVSLATDLRADRYRGLAWNITDLPDNAQARAVWLSDADPGRMQSLPVVVEAGRLRPLIVAGAPGWVGRIRGLGLSVAGPSPQPFRVLGVTAKPMGAGELLADRAAEWFAFERWTGASINVLQGGADIQDLPLSVVVAAIVGIAVSLLLGLYRLRPGLLPRLGAMVAIVFVAGWLLLDARWGVNLARQVALTSTTFAGKSERDKKLADVDGVLYEFIERVREALPAQPQRIWVASDAPFFNGRSAYHLYPHNVHFRPRDRAMPDPAAVKRGDWLLVFNRRGVEFNPRNGTLRWDGGVDVPAELAVPGNAAALFRIK